MIAESAGTPQLVYELHLTNFAPRPIQIDRIALLDGVTGEAIGGAEGEQLTSWIARAGTPGKERIRQVEPGMRAVVYVNFALVQKSPASIGHRIEFHFASGNDQTPKQFSIAPMAVDRRPPVTVGPPLRGGPWAAVYAPEMERGHRRVVYAIDGIARIPGRFAIDFIRLDKDGRPAPIGATRLDAFIGYGAEVLAVADAVVASVRDDMVEADTLDALPKVSIGDASGNYVALDLGGGRFAFYEHLRRGIAVRPGQRLKRGDVIGHLGLTGQGSEPHLHFHVANTNSLLGAEGLPFRITGVEILGSYPSIEAFGRGGPWVPAARKAPPATLTPAPNMVVRFLKQ